MHIDLNLAPAPGQLTAEICVVGGGAAGITVARQLLKLGHDVMLLESGGLDYEPATAALNAGSNVGENYYELQDARLRLFGGTTAIWGGRIAQLDPIDLEARPWVPHSGWPISWSELARHYPAARKIFDIPEQAATVHDLTRSGVRVPLAGSDKLDVGLWDFDRRFNRFQFDACRDLANHRRCTLLTHATVTALNLRPGGHDIQSLTVRSLQGQAVRISARIVVLAAGGVENPRLLLASRDIAPTGVGNEYGLVGRFFMEHPHARGGRIVGAGTWDLLRAYSRPHRLGRREVAALLKPSAAQQQQRGILNTSLTIAARQAADDSQGWGMRAYSKVKHSVAPTRRGRALWMSTKKTATWLQQHTDPLRPWLLHKLGLREIALVVRAEQAPNPRSRVMLTDQIDPLGMPRVALDWHLTPLDIASVAGLVEIVGNEIAGLALGRVEPASWLRESGGWRTDPLISAHPIGGYHHMGTTRMANDPRHGVTDCWGRVFGVENLYVVGSSVFPTSGWANPTLTMLALALRTGERIAARLARAAAA